ncbi:MULTISPECIES: metallophosphoesterase [Anaeromyxobacter]|uniref:metallophosphoesterase family protein n=1 Tax=Anaeromyxobacter TaxID=161492 RepID=UPI001F5AE5C8|nr:MULTISPECIES: metallophosphoesterase [unclassified Anaeromyxobacter]
MNAAHLRSGSVALVAAALLACVHDVYRAEPLGPRPASRSETERVLVFGDFGFQSIPQRLVAGAMRRATRARPFDLALELGDNIYHCGPEPTRPGAETCRFAEDGLTVAPGASPPDDPLFRVNEAPLAGLRGRHGGPLPIYLALGNHDVGLGGGSCARPALGEVEAMRRRACLAVARRSPEWLQPARHYVLDRGDVRFVVLDTNVVVRDYGGFTLEEELAFVREATAPCGAGRLCFLVGHHPPAAVHWYGTRRPLPYGARMARLLAAAGGRARAFFAGHVHALEHLTLDGLEVFVSGSTAMGSFAHFTTRTPARAQVRFATTAWGYAVLETDGHGYRVDFFDTSGVALHCCQAGAAGACRPVACK